MKEYKLGNCLRGHFFGSFKDMETAKDVLSQRFLLSYPSTSGRRVQMYVHDNNQYDIIQWIACYDGLTDTTSSLTEEECMRIERYD